MRDRIRLLVTGSPAYGHLLPLLPMVRAAHRAGHDVRVATGADLVGPLRGRGVPAYAVGPTWDELVADRDRLVAAHPPADDAGQIVASANALFGRAASSRLPGLRDLTRRWRPDLVLHEPLELGGVLLARERGLPSVTHGYGPMFHEYDWFGPLVSTATGDAGVWAEMLASTALDICPPALRPPGQPLWPDALDLRPTGGDLTTPAAVPAGDLVPGRAGARPLVYATLGTIANKIPGALAATVEALRGLPVDAVVTTGPGVDPASLGPQPAHIVLRTFVPQDALLSRADLVVAHAGAGTMLGALSHGLPQLCLPLGADQPWNAAAAERAGAALVVPEERFGVAAIRTGVLRLLAEPSFGVAARRVQEEIRRMPDADTVLPLMLDAALGGRDDRASA